MHIRHLEKIFSINKVVPVDLFPVFGRYYYIADYPGAFFVEAINFLIDPYYYVSTTVLNDMEYFIYYLKHCHKCCIENTAQEAMLRDKYSMSES